MISVDRAKAILESYGGQPEAWPEDERNALQQALVNSKSLQAVQKEAFALDHYMGFFRHKNTPIDVQMSGLCVQRIMDNLPEQEQSSVQLPMHNTVSIDNFSSRFLDNSRPVLLVASFVLFAVMSFSSVLQININEEAEMLSLSDYMDLYVDDNTIMSGQGINNSEELEILAFLEPDLLGDLI